MCTLKDHFSVLTGNNKLVHLKDIVEKEQKEKQLKLEQFREVEQKRAKLYSELFSHIGSECLEKKLFKPPAVVNCSRTVEFFQDFNGVKPDSARIGMLVIKNNALADVVNKQQNVLSRDGGLNGVASWLTGNYEQKHCRSLQSPVYTLDTLKNYPQADSIHTEEEDRLVNAARQLKLYSFPHLVKSIKQTTDANVNREVVQIRRVQGRQAFAEQERQRARFRRELQEDRLLTNKIKEHAENENRLAHQAELALRVRNAALIASPNTSAEISHGYTEDYHIVRDPRLDQGNVRNTSGRADDEESGLTELVQYVIIYSSDD
ncbi:hypothetical protein PHET_10240 [Paragonimus heterotremus]|uniref:Uncharacterized protein n=1 Tax=Paragonimus heterotremus TaxID=100268 RepID=A0A8J4T316_9TREM|nr:hypothetical protein PHET_10240 [Paragonimus heterotremus]